MARRVGIDLVSVSAVRQSIGEHGERYLKRFYTEGELRDCDTGQGIVAERLAARFAAKEATLKVLRPGTIGVVRHGPGWVTVELSGRAAAFAAEQGITDFELSISHQDDYASAVVIAEVDLSYRRTDPMISA
jgi:holo-[acyl-carrier protein] synthase